MLRKRGRSLTQSGKTIGDYEQTAGQRRIGVEKVDGTQPGDPYKAAQKIMEIVKAGNVPFRLILGRDAVEVVEDVLKQRTEELKKWKEFGSQTDF